MARSMPHRPPAKPVSVDKIDVLVWQSLLLPRHVALGRPLSTAWRQQAVDACDRIGMTHAYLKGECYRGVRHTKLRQVISLRNNHRPTPGARRCYQVLFGKSQNKR